MSDDARVVYVTAPREKALEIARALVERRLCACVNVIGDVRSVYRWEGEVKDDPEALLVLKTTAAAFGVLRDTVLELHPYDLPEVIALPVSEGHGPYLDWIAAEVAGS